MNDSQQTLIYLINNVEDVIVHRACKVFNFNNFSILNHALKSTGMNRTCRSTNKGYLILRLTIPLNVLFIRTLENYNNSLSRENREIQSIFNFNK